jgi:hypothetical protein
LKCQLYLVKSSIHSPPWHEKRKFRRLNNYYCGTHVGNTISSDPVDIKENGNYLLSGHELDLKNIEFDKQAG